MPNCNEPDCKTYVADQGMYCRIHQERDADEVEYLVTYEGDGIKQMPFGNFSKGTSATVPKRVADALANDPEWVLEEL